MLFSNFSRKIQDIFRDISGKNKLSQKDIENATGEIRNALLDADVNLKVVNKIIENVKIEANQYELLNTLDKSQNIIKCVRKNMISLMENDKPEIIFSDVAPTVIMMVGLQGAGKTTTSAKIAKFLKNQNKTVLLCSCDVSRPAAIEQLEILSNSIGVPIFIKRNENDEYSNDVIQICKEAHTFALHNNKEVLIIDTAGRLQIDQNLMNELKNIKRFLNPNEILLTVDAMIGQEASEVAQKFNDELDITGVILTKLDGDARGGAALSIKETIGKTIRFFCDGEKLSNFNVFYADRMVDRMLGMGDVLSLIEKAEKAFEEEETKKLEENLAKGRFTYEDFLVQIQGVKKMGSLSSIASMLPIQLPESVGEEQEKKMAKMGVIIQSMTIKERKTDVSLTYKRKARIAKGSGTTINDVNKLIDQFSKIQKMMQMLSGTAASGKLNPKEILNNKGFLSNIAKMAGKNFPNLPFGNYEDKNE